MKGSLAIIFVTKDEYRSQKLVISYFRISLSSLTNWWSIVAKSEL